MISLSLSPQAGDWKKLAIILPDEFGVLLDLCMHYHELAMQISTHLRGLTTEYGEINRIVASILAEYKRLLKYSGDSRIEMKDVDGDIQKLLSRFITPQGKIEPDLVGFMKARENKTADIYMSNYMSLFDAFIQGRIYAPLRALVTKNWPSYALNAFVVRSGQASGIYPEFKKDGQISSGIEPPISDEEGT